MKPIIVFLGPVGAGKTTQIRCLVEEFTKIDIPIKCSIVKYNRFLPRYIFLLLRDKIRLNKKLLLKIDRTFTILNLILNALIILPICSLFKVILPAYLGKIVFVEEYVFGSIIDFIHACWIYRINLKMVKILIHLLFMLLYKNDSKILIVLLMADYSTLQKRWIKRKSPKESSSYLLTQYICFSIYARKMDNIIVINNKNKSVKETNIELKKYIISWLRNDIACL